MAVVYLAWYLMLMCVFMETGYIASASPSKEFITKWAPLMYLANGEKYRPSSVPFFFRHTKLRNDPHLSLNIANIPECYPNCFLTSKGKIKSSTSQLDFFKGENPSNIPTYAVVKEEGSTTHIYYWFFFPYNYGKRVCVGFYGRNYCPCRKVWGHCICPRINGCVGFYKVFGNHVGDWEHIRVTFKNDEPDSIRLSYHGIKVIFNYNGQDFVAQDGTNKMAFFGTHPIAYIAYGSHGVWSSTGDHVYKHLPNGDRLVDKCSQGVPWMTWKNLVIGPNESWNTDPSSPLGFFRFKGRWGNEKFDCHIYEKISNQCGMNSGPNTPRMN